MKKYKLEDREILVCQETEDERKNRLQNWQNCRTKIVENKKGYKRKPKYPKIDF